MPDALGGSQQNPYPVDTPGYQYVAYDSSPAAIATAATLFGADGYAIGSPGKSLPSDPPAPSQPWWSWLTPGLANPSGVKLAPDGSYVDPSLGYGTDAGGGFKPSAFFSGLEKVALIVGAVVVGIIILDRR